MPYDVCELAEDPTSDVFPRAKRRSGAQSFTFWKDPPETFSIGAEINRGASGVIYEGTFGTRPLVIKANNARRVKREEDENEVRMQVRLYCHVRDRPPKAKVALVPETFFAAEAPRFGRVLGMERVDRSLLAHVKSLATPAAQVATLRDAFVRVAALLELLQRDLRFVHGDLHGENVMVRDAPFAVFVIDFGMASVEGKRHQRLTTDERYIGVPFHAELDLITLATSLREDLGLAGCARAARWCGALVQPFWKVVLEGLFSGKVRQKLRYGAHSTVRAARDELRRSGEVYYAHHLLYDSVGDVRFPPCAPAAFAASVRAAATVPEDASSLPRIFAEA